MIYDAEHVVRRAPARRTGPGKLSVRVGRQADLPARGPGRAAGHRRPSLPVRHRRHAADEARLSTKNARIRYESLSHASGIASLPAAPGELSAILSFNQIALRPFIFGLVIALTPCVYPGRRDRR